MLSSCPPTARLPSLPSLPSCQTARGRTAAFCLMVCGCMVVFSFPSHRQTARGPTAALAAGPVSAHRPRCPRWLGPLLRHGCGRGCGCNARCGGGARPKPALHRRPHCRSLAGPSRRPVSSACGLPQRHWQATGVERVRLATEALAGDQCRARAAGHIGTCWMRGCRCCRHEYAGGEGRCPPMQVRRAMGGEAEELSCSPCLNALRAEA